ncbi:putative mevalonate kinase-like [Apostichopus japonicus]|uniref:Mevalonate kinase n=1 Tax=Stichopus japonicus TaxID=307972 RepID=A0A2G8L1R7_STIJA|nr:putative mevalonate kinase-like [Apostichopus japonicus]
MDLKTVLTSSPGKIILHGEHAVVHGTTALASSLNLRSYLQLISSPDEITLNFPDLDLQGSWDTKTTDETFSALVKYGDDGDAFLDDVALETLKDFAGLSDDITTKNLAVIAFLYLYICIFKSKSSSELPGLKALATSNLPTGAGLGSSAAFSSSLAAGLLLVSGTIPVPSDGTDWTKGHYQVINRWAYQGERVIHGNPSGIDNAISVSGGALRYKAKVFEPLDEMPSLKILLVNTKVARSTKVLVAGVKDRLEKYPGVIRPVFDSIEEISQRCQSALTSLRNIEEKVTSESRDNSSNRCELYQTMEELIDMNQSFLKILGVSHRTIEHICSVTAEFDIHSKLTGAGGGGCVFAVIRPDFSEETLKKVMAKLKDFGYDSWITSIGGVGVSYHPDVEDVKIQGFSLPNNFPA